jgi:hypothetical protein
MKRKKDDTYIHVACSAWAGEIGKACRTQVPSSPEGEQCLPLKAQTLAATKWGSHCEPNSDTATAQWQQEDTVTLPFTVCTCAKHSHAPHTKEVENVQTAQTNVVGPDMIPRALSVG